MAASHHGPAGGQTRVQTPSIGPQTTIQAPRQAVLHLRGATRQQERAVVEDGGVSPRTRRRIQWAEDVIDNEGLGRKKSKVCCIYHAPKEFGESSDESSSDSDDSDSDSGDDGSARPARRPAHNHEHDHNHRPGGHDHAKDKGKGKGRARSPNAYEKMPRSKKGGSK